MRGTFDHWSRICESVQPTQLAVTTETLHSTATADKKDITQLTWKEGKKAPQGMCRGAAVVDGNTMYINSYGSHNVYSCQITSGGLLWSSLPESCCTFFSLAVVDCRLTHIGGYDGKSHTNTLHSLTGEGSKKQWSEIFPSMPLACCHTASVTTELALVVAGGWDGRKIVDMVQVMNIPTKQWTISEYLPHPFSGISGTICGDQLYLGGGSIGIDESSKSILTCSLADLLSPQSVDVKLDKLSLDSKQGLWREVKNLPVTESTLITHGGHLLAIGGKSDSRDTTADIHCYDYQTDTWHVTTTMKKRRYKCLVAVLPENQLLIVGGRDSHVRLNTVEIGNLP